MKSEFVQGQNNCGDDELPLVYSCSGCSDVAQLTNNIAVEFDKRGLAEMSCIAGVGGNVKPLVRKAQSGRKIIALDGCPLQCAKHCLNNAGVKPDLHYVLTEFGLKKSFHREFCAEDSEEVMNKIIEDMSAKEMLTKDCTKDYYTAVSLKVE